MIGFKRDWKLIATVLIGITAAGVMGCNRADDIEEIDEIQELSYENYNTEQYFPDEKFRAIVEKSVGVKPGEPFSRESLEEITGRFTCAYRNLNSLQGIEFLTNITELNCSGNQLIELDIRQNKALRRVNFSSNQIQAIDLSQNQELTQVICDENILESLDLSALTFLEKLDCRANQLSVINVAHNPNLIFLGLEENLLKEIDVSSNQLLEELYLSMNQLSLLDVSNNLQLKRLDIDANSFEQLPELSHLAKLETLDIRWNLLTCDAWEQIVALKNRLEEPQWGSRQVEYGIAIRKGFAYSPQRMLDPYDCAE